jgi:cell division protein FtsB
MNPILDLLKKIHPGIQNNHLFKLLEYAALILMIYGVYVGASGDLSTAKHNRDEQITGIMAQVGFNHTQVEEIKDKLKLMEANDKEAHGPQDAQLKELAVDVATLQERVYALKEKNEALTNWNKALSERVRLQEARRGH